MTKRIMMVAGVGAAVAAALLAPGRRVDPNAQAGEPRVGRAMALDAPKSRPGATVLAGDRPLDMTSMIERTHFAFEQHGSAFVGGETSYGVKVTERRIAVGPDNARRVAEPLEVRTVAFGRTGAITRPSSAFTGAEDGHLTAVIDDSTVEHVRNTAAGVEQSWVLDAVPSGTGDLVMRIATSGERYTGATGNGLHFEDPQTRLGVNYSNATWIDSEDNRHEIVAELDGTDIVLRVPSEVVDNASYPVVLDPTIGPEYAMDTPILGPAADIQTSVSIAHGGAGDPFFTDFLVVWQDRRRDVFRGLGGATPHIHDDIYGVHVRSYDGLIPFIEPLGFIINDPVGWIGNRDCKTPRAVFDPNTNSFLVVFLATGDTIFTGSGGQIQLRKLPNPSTTTPFGATWTLSASPHACMGDCSAPDIAVIGSRMLVTWRDNTTVRVATFGLVDAGGGWIVVDNEIVDSSNTASVGTLAHVASSDYPTGSPNFLVTWELNGQVRGQIFTPTTTPVGFNQILLSPPPGGGSLQHNRVDWLKLDPSIAHSWMVVADYETNTANKRDIAGVNLTSSGVLQTAQFGLVNGSDVATFPVPIGEQAGEALVVFLDQPTAGAAASIHGRRILTTGTTLTPDPLGAANGFLIGGSNVAPTDGAVDGHFDDAGDYFVAWQDSTIDAHSDIWAAKVNAAAGSNDLPPFRLSASANRQVSPDVAACGTRYLVVWTDSRNGSVATDIYGTLLDEYGAVVAANLPISTGAQAQSQPAVACNGTNFYVVWSDLRGGSGIPDIYGNAINSTTGARILPSDVQITNTPTVSETHPRIAYGGGYYFVVYDGPRPAIKTSRINASTGAFVDTFDGVTFSRGGRFPDIDFDGARFLIVAQTLDTGTADIEAGFATPAKVTSARFVIENDAANQQFPRVRWDGTNYLIVYEDFRNTATSNYTDVEGRQVTPAGVVSSVFPIVENSFTDDMQPTIAHRTGTLNEVVFTRVYDDDLFDMAVLGQTMDGPTQIGAPYTISGTANVREQTPAVACMVNNDVSDCEVPYRVFDVFDTMVSSVDRIKARVLSF